MTYYPHVTPDALTREAQYYQARSQGLLSPLQLANRRCGRALTDGSAEDMDVSLTRDSQAFGDF